MSKRDLFIPPVEYLMITIEDMNKMDEEIRPKGDTRQKLEQAVAAVEFMVSYLEESNLSREEVVAIAAGKLLYELILLHPLEDGNKRFATVVYLATLKINGFEIIIEGAALSMVFDAVVRLARNPKEWDEVEEALKELAEVVKRYSRVISALDS